MFKKSLTLFFLMGLGLITTAQTDVDTLKNTRNDVAPPKAIVNQPKQNVNYWFIAGLSTVSEVYNEEEIEGLLGFPDIGFDLYFSRKRPGRVIERGLSIGWQPIGTIDTLVAIDSMPTAHSLRSLNQMIHLHYTPRITIFRNAKVPIYAEGIVGIKAAALTYQVLDENNAVLHQDVEKFIPTWNLGYAAGARFKMTDHMYIDIRYARVTTGFLEKIDDVELVDNQLSYSTSIWEAPVGYLRIGLQAYY
tara:strand:+ start:1278 stop:2021 length:744 start_codon:yes stop_codon:yes gene_type:complete